jgi:hypothetical protein
VNRRAVTTAKASEWNRPLKKTAEKEVAKSQGRTSS